MENKYITNANLFKALSDPHRIMILEMLSGGERCACKILEKMNITQPTLSHHMKILYNCGLVNAKQEGKWMHYSLNYKNIKKINMILNNLIKNNEFCI